MIEKQGNLWDFVGIKVITTNGFVKQDGSCVMGRGCAREAALRYPKLPYELGKAIRELGNRTFYWDQYKLFTLPVKHNWWEKADIELIKKSVADLWEMSHIYAQYDNVIIPRPGCGNGGLDWEKDVKPVIGPILAYDQYVIVSF